MELATQRASPSSMHHHHHHQLGGASPHLKSKASPGPTSPHNSAPLPILQISPTSDLLSVGFLSAAAGLAAAATSAQHPQDHLFVEGQPVPSPSPPYSLLHSLGSVHSLSRSSLHSSTSSLLNLANLHIHNPKANNTSPQHLLQLPQTNSPHLLRVTSPPHYHPYLPYSRKHSRSTGCLVSASSQQHTSASVANETLAAVVSSKPVSESSAHQSLAQSLPHPQRLYASNNSLHSLSSSPTTSSPATTTSSSASSSVADLVATLLASKNLSQQGNCEPVLTYQQHLLLNGMSGVTVANSGANSHPLSPLAATASGSPAPSSATITSSTNAASAALRAHSSGSFGSREEAQQTLQLHQMAFQQQQQQQLLQHAHLFSQQQQGMSESPPMQQGTPDSPPIGPFGSPGSHQAQQPSPATLQQFRQQILELKQQQQLQQQLLLQHYQQQQAQLNEHHEKQIQEHIRTLQEYFEHQKKLEAEAAQMQAVQEAREREVAREKERAEAMKEKANLEALANSITNNIHINSNSSNSNSNSNSNSSSNLKKKKDGPPSAIASMEVKQRLQEFVLAKKQQREAAAAAAAAAAANGAIPGSGPGGGQGTPSPPTSRIGPWHATLGKYDHDFPLRKTASEPNLKVRSALKAKVIQRRSSPLLRRKDKPSPLKRRTMSNDMANGIPENSCSPPSGGALSHQSSFQSSAGSTPIQEEPTSQHAFNGLSSASVIDLQLYSSPSLPNISLGRPHHQQSASVIPLTASSLASNSITNSSSSPGSAAGNHNANQNNKASVIQFNESILSNLNKAQAGANGGQQFTEMQMRALRLSMAAAAAGGNAASGGNGGSSSPGPFFPSLPVIEGEFTPPSSPTAFFQHQQQQQRIREDQQRAIAMAMQAAAAAHNSSNPNIFAAAAAAAAASQQPNSSPANFSAAALANSAALYSYATAAAAVGIGTVPDQMAAAAAAAAAAQLYNRSMMQAAAAAAASAGSPNSPGGGGGGGAMRPTAALHAARLVQRPLGRTQSAPLPLGHPALLAQGQNSPNGSGCKSPNSSSPSGSSTQGPSASSLVKQQIRAAVLTRASSKSQMVENVEEETEAAVAAAEMDDCEPKSKRSSQEDNEQVIDLTAKSRHGSTGSNPESSTSASPFPPVDFMNASHFGPLRIGATSGGSASNIHAMAGGRQSSLAFAAQAAAAAAAAAASGGSAFPLEHNSHSSTSLAAALYQRSLLAAAVAGASGNNASSGGTSSPSSSSFRTPLLQHHQLHNLQHSHSNQYHSPHPGRPLSRTLSSPQVMLSMHSSTTSPKAESPVSKSPDVLSHQPSPTALTAPGSGASGGVALRFTTALIYDSFMQKHQCNCSDAYQHPEHGGRLQSIWARLTETGLAARCERLRSRKATLEEIQTCHSESYTLLFGSSPHNRHKIDPARLSDLPIKSFVMLPCGGIGIDSDTTWNEMHTSGAARMAAGCVIELATRVALKEVKNGFAVVRPPGSHAEYQQPMGFCYFNSLAIAAKQLQSKLSLKRILIVDWDVHHGNGLQQAFYEDPSVLYISLHRHDEGQFFPGTGDLAETGSGAGTGFNVNIGWSGALSPPMGDAEYLAAFRSVLMPIARHFAPEIVLVACGFDGARGHPPPLGGYLISPAAFGYMTQQLMTLAEGRLVMALEGGYELTSICDSAQACVSALLGDPIAPVSNEEVRRPPAPVAVDLLNRVIDIHSPHWSILRRYAHLVGCDALEAARKEREECETVNAMASLTMQHVQSPESSSVAEEPMEEDNNDK